MTTRYVNTAADSGGDGTTNNTSSGDGTHAYNTLSAAETGEAASLSAPLEILCSGGADSGPVGFTGGWTTTATNDVTIKPNTGQEHGGAWNTGVYRRTSSASWQNGVSIQIPHCYIEGIQANVTHSNSKGFWFTREDTGCFDCIVKGSSASGQEGCHFAGSSLATGQMHSVNGLYYDLAYGIRKQGYNPNVTYAIYNNTCDNNSSTGLRLDSGRNSATRIFNNLLTGNTTDYSAVHTVANHDNNVTSDATSPDTAHRSKTVTYDTGADVFTTSDADVVGLGTDLSGDSLFPFSTDIAGNSRSAWDAGAFEDQGGTPENHTVQLPSDVLALADFDIQAATTENHTVQLPSDVLALADFDMLVITTEGANNFVNMATDVLVLNKFGPQIVATENHTVRLPLGVLALNEFDPQTITTGGADNFVNLLSDTLTLNTFAPLINVTLGFTRRVVIIT